MRARAHNADAATIEGCNVSPADGAARNRFVSRSSYGAPKVDALAFGRLPYVSEVIEHGGSDFYGPLTRGVDDGLVEICLRKPLSQSEVALSMPLIRRDLIVGVPASEPGRGDALARDKPDRSHGEIERSLIPVERLAAGNDATDDELARAGGLVGGPHPRHVLGFEELVPAVEVSWWPGTVIPIDVHQAEGLSHLAQEIGDVVKRRRLAYPIGPVQKDRPVAIAAHHIDCRSKRPTRAR